MMDAEAVSPRSVEVGGAWEQATTRGVNLFDGSAMEFSDSDYIHTFQLADHEELRQLVDRLSEHVGESVAYSCKAAGTASGAAVGNLRFFVGGDAAMVLNPGVSAAIPESIAQVEQVVVYGSTNGASVRDYQFEFGTATTAYEPYTGGKPSPNPDYPQPPSFPVVTALDFSGQRVELPRPVELRALPDGTRDALRVTRDGVGVVRRVFESRLSDYKTMSEYGDSCERIILLEGPKHKAVTAASQDGAILCDSIQPGAAWAVGDSIVIGVSSASANYVYVRIPGTETITDAKAWVGEHDARVWLPLEHDTTEDLGPVHLPAVCTTAGPATVTAITDSGPDPSIEVEYVRSLPLVIGQLSTAILEA